VDDLVSTFRVESVDVPPADRLEPDWNVAPTKPVYAVLTRRGREPDAPREPTRRLVTLRWGLVPSWASDPRIGTRMINARIETAASKPAFRESFARRRCLLPADGYYEWYAPDSGAARRAKQPFFIRGRDGATLAMAGLYAFWRDPSTSPDAPSAWLRTCTILTTTATDAVGHIHDRQPLFVEPRDYAGWLDPDWQDVAGLRELLVAAPGPGLEAYPVSTAVNDHRNNGPELVAPLPAAESVTLF